MLAARRERPKQHTTNGSIYSYSRINYNRHQAERKRKERKERLTSTVRWATGCPVPIDLRDWLRKRRKVIMASTFINIITW